MDVRFPKPLLQVPRRVDYHVWSMRTITLVAISVVIVTATSVFLLGKRSLFQETGLTLGIIAAALFAFLATGLHLGARVKRWDLPGVDRQLVSFPEVAEGFAQQPGAGFESAGALDGAEGCAGAIVGLLVSVFAGVILMFVLWVVINLGILIWVFLVAALSWVFYLALRQVFAKTAVCRGHWPRSLGYALLYTALYTGWLFALVWIAHALFGPRLRGG